MVRESRPRQRWTPEPQREIACLASAVAMARFALTSPELLQSHRNELLSIAIWKWTERNGKVGTRYRSEGVLSLGNDWRKHVNHEHVLTRLHLRNEMLAQPNRVADILQSATACLVTRTEHQQLTQLAPGIEGWERYLAAGVNVYDMATGVLIIENGAYVNDGPTAWRMPTI